MIIILEKKQKERKETIGSLGETKTSSEGLLFPIDSDKQKESERIEKYEDYFEKLNGKVDHDILAQKYSQLINEYSDENTGYQKFLDQVEYWDNVNNKEADKKQEEEIKTETKKTVETIKKEVEELEEQIEDVKTQEEKDSLNKKIEEKKKELEEIEEDFSEDLNKITDDLIDDFIPIEKQYGTDEYINQALAWVTPFKTVNKETIDAKDENDKRISWKEIAIEHGYDHDLTVFLLNFYKMKIAKFPDKYEVFVIKDTVDLMKERLSQKQLESFEEGNFKESAIIVFGEKGKKGFLKFKNGKTVAFSYNQKAFDSDYDERVRINSERTNRSKTEVIDFFRKQQTIFEAIRERVVTDNVQVPIKIIHGSMRNFMIGQIQLLLLNLKIKI